MHVGDDQIAHGAEDAGELGVDRHEIANVGQGQPCHDQADIGRWERQVGELTDGEGDVGGACPGSLQHRRRAVDADDLEAECGQLEREAPGAAAASRARPLGSSATRSVINGWSRLEQAVVFAVVRGGPARVRRLRRRPARSARPGVRRQLGVVEQRAHRSQAVTDEPLVVVMIAGPGRTGDPLPAREVGEGVLIDHSRTLADATAPFQRVSG